MAGFLKEHKGIILVGALLVLAAVLLLTGKRKPGRILVITKDGEEICREELKDGMCYRVETEYGYNVFSVKRTDDGELCVICEEADCAEQICVKKGAVLQTDDPIVCLPHRVTARLITGK